MLSMLTGQPPKSNMTKNHTTAIKFATPLTPAQMFNKTSVARRRGRDGDRSGACCLYRDTGSPRRLTLPHPPLNKESPEFLTLSPQGGLFRSYADCIQSVAARRDNAGVPPSLAIFSSYLRHFKMANNPFLCLKSY